VISTSQRPLPTQQTTNTRFEYPCLQRHVNRRSQHSRGLGHKWHVLQDRYLLNTIVAISVWVSISKFSFTCHFDFHWCSIFFRPDHHQVYITCNTKRPIYIYIYIYIKRPPLCQSFWLQIQRSRVRSPTLPHFLSSSGSGTGSTQPREVKLRSYLNKKSSGSRFRK